MKRILNKVWFHYFQYHEVKGLNTPTLVVVGSLLTDDELKLLKETYRNYRNCVQHWVFKRMYNKLIEDKYITNQNTEVMMCDIDSDTIESAYSWASHPYIRRTKILFAFQIVAQISFDIAYKLLSKFQLNFETKS
jgi:uncharacterized membrane protein YheB (UPF0754 family)